MRGRLPALAAAVAALSILIAAPATQAKPMFTVSQPAATLEGERKGSDSFEVNEIDFTCDRVTFNVILVQSSPTLELLPEHYDCTAKVLTGLVADFFQERCSYVLHDLEQTVDGGWWKADVDLKCRGGYWAIGWDLFETAGTYREARDACSIRIIKQDDAGTAKLRNLDNRADGIEVQWNLSELDYRIYTVGGFASSLLCGSLPRDPGIASNASYQGNATVSALGSTALRITG